jgi:List-Bact-rpt repeat protein
LKWLIPILLAVPLLAQEPTITLNGTSYTMQPHPRVFFNAALNTRIAYSGGLAPKAVSSNPAWVATAAQTSGCAVHPDPSTTHNYDSSYTSGNIVALYATRWYSDNTQTQCLTYAEYLINNMQQYVSLVCADSVSSNQDCVHGGNGYWNGSYGPAYYMTPWIEAYELIRSQLTSTQQQAFAEKWLGDLAAWGGIGGSPSTSCTNPTLVGTTSVSINSGGTVTASAPYFGAGQTLQVGDWIYESGAPSGAVIASVTSSTVATIESDVSLSGYSGTLYTRRGGWVAGDCGWLWLTKHDWYTPHSIIGTSVYPSGTSGQGGINGTGSFNLVLSATYGIMAALLSVADDDVNFSSRSSVEITALYNYWHTTTYLGLNEFNYTGFTPTGSVYGIWRAYSFYPLTADSVVNSVVSPPPLMSGLWAKNMAHHFYLSTFPSCPAQEQEYGQQFSPNSSYNTYLGWSFPGLPALVNIFNGTNEGAYLNYWMQNLWQTCPNGGYSGNTPGTNLMWTSGNLGAQNVFWGYIFTDPAYSTNSALPTGSVDNCSDAGCSGAVPTSTALPMAGMVSRTGYSSITDTLVNFYALAGIVADHNGGDGLQPLSAGPGDVRIFKGGSLLGDDWTTWNNGGALASDISIGSDSNFPANPIYTVLMPAGANDASNRYTYALVDMTQSYKAAANVTGAERYLIHFKKPGTQDFVVVYDYVKTSAAEQVIDYWHYPQTTGTTFSGSTVTSSFAGTGHSDTAQLLTKFLQPAGSTSTYAYTNNTNGTYTGGNGDTFRVSVCGSSTGSSCGTSTTAEFAIVHEPVAGSGGSLPSLSMLATIDANHRGVEIDGTSPKVAVFPIGTGEPTFTSATFTTAVPGTAQFLVTGLSTGSYNVTIGGSPVVSGAAVVAGNNSLYFEGGSGAVVVSLASATLTLPSPTCPAGTQYVAYGGCTLAASGGTPPYTYSWVNPTTSYASIPEGLSVNASTGAISGTVYGQGGYTTQFKVTDSASNTATATVTFAIAGNNTLGGCSLFPATSAFHINVSGLSVDTSPAAAIQSGYLSSSLKVLFGAAPQGSNFPNGIPFLVVPYNQTDVNVTTTVYQSYFTSGPFPVYAPIESTSNASGTSDNDNHTLIVQTTGSGSPYCQLWEMWQGLPPYTNGLSGNAWKDSSNAYWANIGSSGTGAYAMLPQGNGSTDAAGLPVTPLLVNADEVIGTGTPTAPTGAVQHPIRFTVNSTLGLYVWPATAKAGSGTCSGGFHDSTNHLILQGTGAPTSCTTTMPMGEIYRLKASVYASLPSCFASSPQSMVIATGLANYGIILADNGTTGGIIGTPDSRWNDADLACLTNLTLTNFEPVNVSSVIATTTPNYQGSGYAAPVTSYQTSSGATYAITVAYAGAGSGTTSGTNVPGSGIAPGTAWTATGTPATGSNCVSMTDNMGGTPSGCSDSGTMPSANGVVTTTFALNSYTISTSVTGSGTITGCAGAHNYGSSWSCNLTPAAGYTLTGATGCGGSLAGSVYSGTQGAASCTVTATFTATTYTLSTSITGSGTLTGTNCPASAITAGTSWSCTASPSAGYTISSLTDTCGGTVAIPVDSGTMPTSNCAVSVIFAATTAGKGIQAGGTNSGTVLQ